MRVSTLDNENRLFVGAKVFVIWALLWRVNSTKMAAFLLAVLTGSSVVPVAF